MSKTMNRAANVLEIQNVTKRFGNLVAVRDVSLNVAKGELCAIIGPNGAGKTTFFNLISGFFPPTSGSIRFDGQDITKLSTHERVTRGMARTFQITEIFPELTVFENVRIAAEVASGYRLRPWINRTEATEIHRRVEDTTLGSQFRQAPRSLRGNRADVGKYGIGLERCQHTVVAQTHVEDGCVVSEYDEDGVSTGYRIRRSGGLDRTAGHQVGSPTRCAIPNGRLVTCLNRPSGESPTHVAHS